MPEITYTSCVVTANTVTIVIAVASSDDMSKLIGTISGFKNPSSTTTLSGITTKITAGTVGSAIDGNTYTSTTINNITPDYMTAATVSTTTDQIGGTGSI